MAGPITERIQELLAPPDAALSDARTLEHINGLFPSFEAFLDSDVLDSELQKAEVATTELATQLNASKAALSKTISNTLLMTSNSLKSAKELSLTRHSLADQLATLTEELAPAAAARQRTLLEDLEDLHTRLAELKVTRTYVATVERALSLREDAIAEVQASANGTVSQECLSKYIELQKFVESVKVSTTLAVTPESGSEALNISGYLVDVCERTWKDIIGALSANLEKAAEQLRWPAVITVDAYQSADTTSREAFESNFVNLLRLQAAGEAINLHKDCETPEKQRIALRREGLYPLQTLLEPITLRFRYHFDGKRQTNRLDKPEWYLTHVLNLMHEHRPFVSEILQGLLQKGGYGHINASDEFCRLLFNLPSRKLKRTVPVLLETPAILAHTVYQTLIFDGTVRDGGFDIRRTWEGHERMRLRALKAASPGSERRRRRSLSKPEEAVPEWEGISDIILSKKDWFDAWLEGERRFSDNQYNEIISSPDAWQISDDAGDDDAVDRRSADLISRVTTSARRFKALIERITERYQPLPSLTHRSHFLFDVQLPLLEAYLSRITSSLDAYERLSSSFVRAVPGALAGQVGHGADTKRLTSGVEGLSRIVKALVSARWVKAAMEGWGEDLFFLELWQGIQENPLLRARADDHPMLPRSRAIHTIDDQAESTLFDMLIEAYGRLVSRAEDMIQKQVCNEVEGELKEYFATQWEPVTSEDDSSASTLPATLVAPVSLFSSEISFLAQSLPASTVTQIYRRIVTVISGHILQRSVTLRGRNQFSPKSGAAFREECSVWVQTSRLALASGGPDPLLVRRVELPWQNLTDVASIIGASEELYTKAENSAYAGSEDQFSAVMEELGVRTLKRDDVRGILRARTDFSR